jgi:hypothetical protein
VAQLGLADAGEAAGLADAGAEGAAEAGADPDADGEPLGAALPDGAADGEGGPVCRWQPPTSSGFVRSASVRKNSRISAASKV